MRQQYSMGKSVLRETPSGAGGLDFHPHESRSGHLRALGNVGPLSRPLTKSPQLSPAHS